MITGKIAGMSLAEFCAAKRTEIMERLQAQLPPLDGDFDLGAWQEGKERGKPQMGPTRYSPHFISFEFSFPAPGKTAVLLTVTVPSPERVVFLPVPDWVVESIWQGEIDGTYHFEGDAQALLAAFSKELTEDGNKKWFEPRMAKRRE